MSERPFLRARWENLLVVTYPVPDDLVSPLAPDGVEVDHLGGSARVSFVAFEFAETRVFGLAIPGHTAFPEINLRFYVRSPAGRGIVFIREFVPRRAIAVVARLRYNEPYRCIRMRSELDAGMRLRHVFGPGPSSLTARIDARGADPAPDSDGRWLTDQSYGFGRTRRGRALAYRVRHPLWPLHAVRDLEMAVDFAGLYGPQWGFLADATPSHVSFARGSEVAVYPPA